MAVQGSSEFTSLLIPMHEQEIENLAMRWIEFQRLFLRSCEGELTSDLECASDDVLHMPFEAPEETWRFIQAVIRLCEEEDVLGSLAAGPIEDLLSQHGEDFIGRLESFARDNPRFRAVLRGVWKGSMSDDVWEELQALFGPSERPG
jgi:hypothetical protein